jgi:hypothetical protein
MQRRRDIDEQVQHVVQSGTVALDQRPADSSSLASSHWSARSRARGVRRSSPIGAPAAATDVS